MNTKDEKRFEHYKIKKEQLKSSPEYNLIELHKDAQAELTLQQSKRDQIITIYLAIFSFLIPFALSLETLDWAHKGIIFIAVGIIGVLFAMIIIRYRIYKESYWFCCQTLTVLMNYKQEELKKGLIQEEYFNCIDKKGDKFFTKFKENGETKRGKFSNWLFFKYNIFSSETFHYLIEIFITCIILGLGVGLILPLSTVYSILIGLGVGIIGLILLLLEYFKHLKNVYRVLIDGLNKSFNTAFSKAWLLHFYTDDKKFDKED